MEAFPTKEMLDLAENYSEWIFNDCTQPISEVMWLIECALRSENRNEVIDVLNSIPYEK